MKRRWLWFLAALVVLVLGGLGFWMILQNRQSAAVKNLEVEAARIDKLRVSIATDGVVRANQSAQLFWRTTGQVSGQPAQAGQKVTAGQVLAALDQDSLPQGVMLARSQWITAQQALDDLLNSQVRVAQAQKAVEDAQQALEDGRNPALAQANASAALAEASKALDDAIRYQKTLLSPVPETAIQQALITLQQRERVLAETQRQVTRFRNRLNRPENTYLFFESKKLYRRIVESMERKLLQDQGAYDDALSRYNALLEPPDALDVTLADANVLARQAQVAQAQRDLERALQGPQDGELAVLEARLADARREFERLKDGPTAAEIEAARARVAAAQAVMDFAAIGAPFDGVITVARVKPGDLVSPGELAFRLDDLSTILVDAQVSEIDINRVQTGQPVVVMFDAAPEREYHGEVVTLPLVGNSAAGVVSFKITVRLTDADAFVRPGMTATVTIVVGELSEALLVPNRAIRLLDGQRVVYIRRGEEIVPVPVKLGLASETYSQVLESSLQAGDLILLVPPVY